MEVPLEIRTMMARARRAIGDRNPYDLVPKSKAIIGSSNIPDGEHAAKRAYEKLENGEVPDADDLRALEIVIRLLRPVVAIVDGALADLPPQVIGAGSIREDWGDFQVGMRPFLGAIGRIETSQGIHIGTGFLTGCGELLTNRHVLAALSGGVERLGANQARVSFKREFRATDSPGDVVPILRTLRTHPRLDAALLEVASGSRPAIPIDLNPVFSGDPVVTIGYPAEDKNGNPLFLNEVFQSRYGVKCAALGEVLPGSDEVEIFHDCSTTRGNSGSPIFSLRRNAVVGLHRSGFFMYRNEGIACSEFARFIQDE